MALSILLTGLLLSCGSRESSPGAPSGATVQSDPTASSSGHDVDHLTSSSGTQAMGGSDGGGGGLLFYRTAKAIEFTKLILNQVTPDDFAVLRNNANQELLKDFYQKHRNEMLETLDSSMVRLVNRTLLKNRGNFLPMAISPGNEFWVAEDYFDGTVTVNNIVSMEDQIREVLITLFSPFRNWAPDYKSAAWDQTNGMHDTLLQIVKLKRIDEQPGFRALFQYSKELNITMDELLKMKDAPNAPVPDFQSRLDQATAIAKMVLSGQPANKVRYGAFNAHRGDQYRKLLITNLQTVQVKPDLRDDQAFEEFYSKHAHYKNQTIQFTKAARYLRLDELTFLILHEIGHSLPLDKYDVADINKIDDVEHGINKFAYDLLKSATEQGLLKDQINHLFEQDQRATLLNLFTLHKSQALIRIWNVKWNEKPFMVVEPRDGSSETKEQYDGKFERVSRICQWAGGFGGALTWGQYVVEESKDFQAYVISDSGQPELKNYSTSPNLYSTVMTSVACGPSENP